MVVLYSCDVDSGFVVLFDSSTEVFASLSMSTFMNMLERDKFNIIGVDANLGNELIVEVPYIGSDLVGNLIRYISVLFGSDDEWVKVKDGVLTIKYSDSDIESYDVGVESLEDIVGVYYVLDTVVGDVFSGIAIITCDGEMLKQYNCVNGKMILTAEVSVNECNMNFNTNRMRLRRVGRR